MCCWIWGESERVRRRRRRRHHFDRNFVYCILFCTTIGGGLNARNRRARIEKNENIVNKTSL